MKNTEISNKRLYRILSGTISEDILGNNKIVTLLFFLLFASCNSMILFAQSDSTFIRIDILSTSPGDSLYQFKELLLKNVPEIYKWDKDLKSATNNKVSLCVYLFGYYSADNCDSCYYQIYVGENHPTHTTELQFFLINKITHKLFAYDLPNDRIITLQEWRKRNDNLIDFR